MLTLIAAVDTQFAIGKNGGIPWDLSADLAFFQRETLGGAVLMGRRTWESLPPTARPLRNRLNIVVTRTSIPDVLCVTSVEEALDAARNAGYARVYGIGGQAIYTALLPHAHRVLLTHVGLTTTDPDTWFPPLDGAWRAHQTLPPMPGAVPAQVTEYLRLV